MSTEMLNFSHVASGYGEREVLKDVNLTIEEGDFVGLIGSNGTGKSTLLKTISGLIPLKKGSIRICGRESSSLKNRERAQMVAVVPQSFNVDYDFFVEDIVMMGRNPYLSLRKKESQKDFEIVKAAMEATNTEVFRGRYYNQLSGGERQRVILARAIAQQPRMILLDEPTSALDIHYAIEVMELIQRLNEEEKMTVVAVLHDINMASRFCKRITMLRGGEVVADGTPEEVVNRVNMEALYNMKLLIKENALFHKPEIVPIRVLKEKQATHPYRIHVICGGDGASQLLEELDERGHKLSVGVVNIGSDDWDTAKGLELPMVETKPFTAVTPEDQKKNLEMMKEADIVLVADVPFGKQNIENLTGLEDLPGKLFFHKNATQSDYTDGQLTKRMAEIIQKKEVTYYGDHDEFLAMIS